MWWEPELIDRTVTRQFVCSHLLPQEIERLDRPLGFGDGLTDGTYWEWIDEKAKRIFLILVDLGVPDQIFGVIDDSWDDEDLPIALDQVERLALTPSKDEKSEKRFYYRQFYYLLRPLQQGGHNVYQENEVVPLDIVDKKQTLAATQSHHDDKVALPNQPGTVFLRRRIPVGPSSGDSSGCLSPEDFLYEINGIKNVYNQHLISYWASYTYQGNGYVLFTSATDFTLKSFLTTVPSCVKNLDKQVRRQLVMNWIHCLVDTLCFIHNRGLSHGNIKPSTVLFSNDNHVFFADFTRFNPEVMASMADKTSFDKESYDYAAPEQWFRPSSSPPSPGIRRGTLSSLGSSADSAHFSINRGSDYSSNSAMSMMHAPTPQLNPQAADVFSLGCVILELLSFLLKKHGRPFAQHRAAKHKSPGRGGAVLDSSFHKNLGQVESWMTQLAKEASKKDDQVFRGITPMLHVVERMLALHPSERPAAHDVQTKMYQILRDASGISEPHCVHQYGGWDFGIGSLKLSSSSVPRSSSYDTMSIMTKRTSSSRGHHEHTHTRTGSSSTSSMRRVENSIREVERERESERERERERSKTSNDLGSGFQAIKSLRIKDKVRPWNTPVYADMSFG
ncbi:kinase-like domain-containing protein [Bombardia bombarda]|uniref:Kinase-like domain-containing protein n=1 Tax=Bombardia bombarda TaxID=252184 RepID=A0AA39XIF7_9PEZI|nr:kinase-like domain-containing protein [Bombardia bombarda]